MDDATPVRLTGPSALRWGLRFARDPLLATRRCFDAFGPFVVLAEALPFIRPRGVALLGVPLVLTAGAAFHRELLSDPATWRGVSLLPGGPRNSAARRMSSGLTRMTGHRHAHYRRLLTPALRKAAVDALIHNMARLADAEVACWPVGGTIDLWEHPRRLMRRFAVELLFGGNGEQGYRIADQVSRLMEGKWGWGAFVPINLPMTAYGQIVREAELLERRLLEWAASKRGQVDDRDLASIIVNSPDADGNPPCDATIIGQIPSLFGAASEASQSALSWTLLLLAQHPRVERELLDELRTKRGGASPSLDAVGDLRYLDAVVKESMRILPPVPLQIRVAQCDTTIAGNPMPNGTRVMLNTFLTNRMPDLYPEGDVFRPERWFTIAPSTFEFPVFSGGPHSCPGYWFGLTAVKVALAAILTRYRPAVAADARIDYKVQPTMRPLQRVPVVLHRQDGAFAAAPIRGKVRSLVRLPQ
jgi:cytochrome P450